MPEVSKDSCRNDEQTFEQKVEHKARLRRPLTEKEAALLIGVAVQTLRNNRHLGRGLAYYKLSPGPRGRVVYSAEDIEAYMSSCRIDPEAA